MATILIVDDNAANREVIATLLGYYGHRTLDSKDGLEGLSIVYAENPDLIIADVMMPTMNGFEFVSKLRQEPRTARIPVVFYSATFQDAEMLALARASGVSRLLSKPAEPEEVLRVVNEALGSREPDAPPVPTTEGGIEVVQILNNKLYEKIRELEEVNDQLEQRIAQRAESEEKFRNLAETATEAIISADGYSKIVYFNPAAERIFSYSSTEIIGQPLTLLMPERFHDPHRQGFDRFLKTGEARVIGKTVELVARRKNGSEFPIELALSSWKTRAGTFFTAILSDITKRKRAEESIERHRRELAQSNAELAAANQELEAFSYSVSHDLRAPLRSIDGFSQALLEDYAERLDDNGKTHLLRVRAATRRMGELIDDLLNLSRVTRSEMHREKMDLSAVARLITAELERTQPSRQVKFVIEEGLEATADPHLLRIVLENLLGNAWKFTSKRASACIEFAKTRCNGATAYFVRDDGAGFDPAYAKRLFGAFQRLHAISEFPGTGIGLATVQRIVHRHGGRAWAEGAIERGATFYFTLPETNL